MKNDRARREILELKDKFILKLFNFFFETNL